MRILALDCATTTGYAIGEGGKVLESGTRSFALNRGDSPGMRFLRFRAFLERIVFAYKPDLIVYEQAHHRGGAATEVCVGMTTRAQEVAASQEKEHTAIRTMDLKKWATGKGTASKEMMQDEAERRFNHYVRANDPGADEADALLLLAMAQEKWSDCL